MTVHVTVVVPSGKVDGASFEIDATEQLSLATGVPKSTFEAEHTPASTSTVKSAGHVIVGVRVESGVAVLNSVV